LAAISQVFGVGPTLLSTTTLVEYLFEMPPVMDKIVPFPGELPYDKQAVPVLGTKKPGQSGTPQTLR